MKPISSDSDPYCLDDLATTLEAGGVLEARQQFWLLAEAHRLQRANTALDGQFAVVHRANRERDRELGAMQSEVADWMDKCARLEGRLEALEYVREYSAKNAAHRDLSPEGVAIADARLAEARYVLPQA